MIKKILKTLLLVFVLLAGGLLVWLWTIYEPYPERDSTVLGQLPTHQPAAQLYPGWVDQLNGFRAEHNLPSVSIAVGVGDRVIFAAASGYADLDSEIPATPRSMYRTGSVSKPITTVALGRMVDQGLLEFDDEFNDHVPGFPDREWPFSLRQLASHTAGIRHYESPLEMYHDVHYERVADALVLVENDRLLFEPGTRFSYSSYGYNLLSAAMVAAAGTDARFTGVLQEYVFEPARMRNTMAEDARNPHDETVGFYIQYGQRSYRAPYADNSYKIAGGGLVGTPSDLVKFGLALARGALLSTETRQELWTPVILSDGSVNSASYGLGFGIHEKEVAGQSVRVVEHGGGSVGGLTAFAIFPQLETPDGKFNLVIAVTTNIAAMKSDANIWDLVYSIADQWFEAAKKNPRR